MDSGAAATKLKPGQRRPEPTLSYQPHYTAEHLHHFSVNHSIVSAVSSFIYGFSGCRVCETSAPRASAYRNILLLFPNGDTRGHGGLSVSRAVLVCTVWRAQPVACDNRKQLNVTQRHQAELCVCVNMCLMKVSEETGIDSAAEHTECKLI